MHQKNIVMDLKFMRKKLLNYVLSTLHEGSILIEDKEYISKNLEIF